MVETEEMVGSEDLFSYGYSTTGGGSLRTTIFPERQVIPPAETFFVSSLKSNDVQSEKLINECQGCMLFLSFFILLLHYIISFRVI